MEEFLRAFPYLKPCHMYNLFDRFLEVSHGTMLFLYNNARDTYELHSIKSFSFNGESLQATLDDDTISGWLVNDFQANNNEKFKLELESERNANNDILDKYSDRGLELLTTRALKTVEKIIGREI